MDLNYLKITTNIRISNTNTRKIFSCISFDSIFLCFFSFFFNSNKINSQK